MKDDYKIFGFRKKEGVVYWDGVNDKVKDLVVEFRSLILDK